MLKRGQVGGITMIRITKKELIAVAKDELAVWVGLPRGLPLAILWAFIHRITTQETVEETFFHTKAEPITDYQI